MNWFIRLKNNEWFSRLILILAILMMLIILIFGVRERTFRPPVLPNTPAAQHELQVIRDIATYGNQLQGVLEGRFRQVQAIHLEIYATALIGIIPLLGFVGFIIFPFVLIRRHKLDTRYRNINTLKLLKYYLIQAVFAWLVLLTLGASLWLIQVTVALLGNETNPELVLQQQMTNSIIKDRVILVRRFPDVYTQVAQDLKSLPNEPVIVLIMQSGIKVENNELLSYEAEFIEYTWPTFNDFFLFTLGIVVFFYLRRFWLDVKVLVYYPLRFLNVNQFKPGYKMWSSGWRVIKTELKVTLIFSVQVAILAALMGFAMSRFFDLVSAQQVITTSAAMSYVIEKRGNADLAVISILLEVIYLIEAIVIFLITFSFLVGRITNAMRAYFNNYISSAETGKAIRLQIFNFIWTIFLATVLVTGSLSLVEWLSRQYITSEAFTWPAVLILPPLVLLIGLNLGMWLLKGFKTIYLLSMDSFKIDVKKNLEPFV